MIYFSCQNPIEDFENGVPPWGWSVVNNVPGGPTWGNIASCGPNGNGGNCTGGLGDAACMSASSLTAGAYDAELRSPVFSLVGYSDSTISYLANYQNWAGIDRLNFDISSDGGVTWTTLRTWNSDQGAFQNTPGVFTDRRPGCLPGPVEPDAALALPLEYARQRWAGTPRSTRPSSSAFGSRRPR